MKYFIRFFFLLPFLFIATLTSIAQDKIISGKILDVCHNPIPYATVYFKSSIMGATATDLNGSYSTTIPKGADTLVCSRVGYIQKKEGIGNNDIIYVIMQKEAPRQLNLSITGTHKFSDEEKLKRATPQQKEEEDDNRIFTKVEQYAGFPGGYDAFNRYLKKAAAYPDSATIAEVKGIVKVGFIIDPDGYPKNIILLRGINKFADEAVINAVMKSPKWMPPNQNGRYVEVYQEVSVTFDISGVD